MGLVKRSVTRTAALLIVTMAVPLGAQNPAPPPAAPQRWSVERIFDRWDRNRDGKLTPDEVPTPQLFRTLDRNGDGVVTREEATVQGGGRGGQGQRARAGQPQDWRSIGVSEGAPLPPAESFVPRAHGDEARSAGLEPDVLARIDVELQRHVAAKNVAGVVALIHRNGRRGYFETFGMADIEAGRPMQTDGIFRLMSMTKPLIAAAALALVDQGRFTVDEPISKHCPEWANPKVLENGTLVPAKSAITPRMLMSHSSGLYYGSLEDGGGAGRSAGAGTGALAYAAGRGRRVTLREFSEAAAREPLRFQPGTGYSYGISIDVLGRHLEAVAGKPLDDVLKDALLGPLKMVDTDFWVPKEKAVRLCRIYRQPGPGVLEPGRDASPVTVKPTLFLGGHGVCSTAVDFERFCRMLLNCGELDGVRVHKRETVDLMFQNQLKVPGQRYGLGAMVDGSGGYSWGGADGTQFWIDRRNNLFAIFMVQTQPYRSPTYNGFRRLVDSAVGREHPK